MTMRRILLGVILAVIVVPSVILGIFVAQFDPNRYAPAVISAVEASTGRQLTLGGPIKLSWSWTPKIVADNVSLSNQPGFADPNLLKLSRLEARISLVPLILGQVDIVKLILIRPVITLESNSLGRADWDLAPNSTPAGGVGNPTPGSSASFKIALQSVEIQNGLVSIIGAKPSQTLNIALTELAGTAASTSSPLEISAQAAFNSIPFTVTGVVGPAERFSGIGSGPWPVDLTIAAAGATGSIKGNVQEPRNFSSYDLAVKLNIPALEALASLAPKWLTNVSNLPSIHGITGSAELQDQHSALPGIKNLSLEAGDSDLSALRPGLALTGIMIEMPSLFAPISVTAKGTIGALPLSLNGKLGAASMLLDQSWLPPAPPATGGNFPVSLQLQAGAATFGLAGGIATPATLSGVALDATISIPDLSALGGLAGTVLPAWKNISAQGTLIDSGGLGLTKAIGIESLVLTMDHAALGGDASLYFGAEPRLQAAIKAQQIDLDPLLTALPKNSVLPPAPTLAPAVLPQPAPTPYLVPQVTLPLAALRSASADVQVSADTIIFNNAAYTALEGHAVLSNGILSLNPVTAVLPGGSVSGTAVLDAAAEPATVKVAIDAPALALSPFLKALGMPDSATGTVQVGLNASGTGGSLQDIAASVSGQLGLAMVNGIVDGSVLDRLFGDILQTVGLRESLLSGQGPVAVRCFALRMDANNGIGNISALTMDSSRLLIQGGGSLNFGNETLGIIVRPQLRVAGTELGLPVKIGGSFANPTTSIAPLAAVQGAAQSAVGLTIALSQDVPVGGPLFGSIASKLGINNAVDVCPAALALGRLGNPGPAAEPQSANQQGSGNAAAPMSAPKSLLNAIFGK
jgi:AsmA protein